MIPRDPGLPTLLLAVAFAPGCLAHTPAIPGSDGRPDPGSVATLGKVEAAHTGLWPLIGESDDTHPVLPRLQSWPGATEIPTAWRDIGDHKDHLVAVSAGPPGRDPDGQPTEQVVLPFLLYSPETRLGGGVVAAGYRRLQPELPTSCVLGAVTVTTRRQLSVEAASEIHRPGGGRMDGSLRFKHFPDRFFGLGPETADEAEEGYTSRIVHAQFRGQRRARLGLQVGPQLTFRWEDVVETEEGGILAAGDLMGSEGGRWFGLGAAATHDTRDHVVNPRQGMYMELSTKAFPEALGTTGYRSALLDRPGGGPFPALVAVRGSGLRRGRPGGSGTEGPGLRSN